MTAGGPDPRVIEIEECASTNLEAVRLAPEHGGEVWVRADRQTAGRGRSGRRWADGAGNLALSHLFAPGCPDAGLPQLSLVAGVAVIDALLALWPDGRLRGLRLKWPNDVLVGRAKAGGILIEATQSGGRRVAIVGIGINLASAPQVPGRDVTCLADHAGAALDPGAVAHAIAVSFGRWRAVWDRGDGFASICAAWLDRAGPLGEPMMVNAGDGPVAGTFLGLDTDGALLLGDATGARRRFTFGDVTLGPIPDARGP